MTLEGNQGDATWLFNISDGVTPPCVKQHRDEYEEEQRQGRFEVKTCSKENSSNFVKKLIKAAR